MKRLTARQKEILDYICRFIDDSGYPPTVREVAGHFKISVKGAYDHIKAVEKKGFLEIHPGKSRGLRVIRQDESDSDETLKVQILGSVAAGRPLFSDENVEGTLAVPGGLLHSGGRYFALHVRGESMKDAGILDGDMAVIRHQANAENGEIVVAMIDNAVTLKRLYIESNRIRLEAENPAYPPIYTRDARILGKLSCVLRTYS